MLLYKKSQEIEAETRNHKDFVDKRIATFEDRSNSREKTLVDFLCSLLLVGLFWAYLRHKKNHLFYKRGENKLKSLDSEIYSKTKEIKEIEYSSFLLQADIFVQTALFAELKELEAQPRTKDAKVLSYEKQKMLQNEIDRIFNKFCEMLYSIDLKLTLNDIKLCCLSLLPLDSYAKALCFVSTEISVVKQRKHYIKKKMLSSPENKELFDFIFAKR